MHAKHEHEMSHFVTQDPCFQKCLKVLGAMCLSTDIVCNSGSSTATPKFHGFLQEHYKTFCSDALRMWFFCGFMPYYITRLDSGDIVPEALPIGTFSWETHITDSNAHGQPRNKYRSYQNRHSRLLHYEITQTVCDIQLENVCIFELIAPVHTKMGGGGVSPMYSAFQAYKDVVETRKNERVMDEWNTRAHLVATTHRVQNNDGPLGEKTRTGIAYGAGAVAGNHGDTDDQAVRNVNILQMMKSNGIDAEGVDLYTMPHNTTLDTLRNLTSSTNMDNVRQRYIDTVCGLMGVPLSYLDGFADIGDIGQHKVKTCEDISIAVFSAHVISIQNKLCHLLKVTVWCRVLHACFQECVV